MRYEYDWSVGESPFRRLTVRHSMVHRTWLIIMCPSRHAVESPLGAPGGGKGADARFRSGMVNFHASASLLLQLS